MSSQQEIINNFFTEHYNLLLQKSKDYVRVYNYKRLQPEEILSELYLFTLKDQKRTNKLQELIMLSAITLNKMYKYSNLAMYYISRILYNVIHGHRDFTNNNNKFNEKKELKLVYQEIFNEEIPEEDQEETREYNVEDIYAAAEKIGIGEQWYLYEIWKQKYIYHKTYKQISEYFHLGTTPVFSAVRQFNILIKSELQKNNRKYEKI